MTSTHNSGFLLSLGISVLLHVILAVVLSFISLPSPAPRYKEILVELPPLASPQESQAKEFEVAEIQDIDLPVEELFPLEPVSEADLVQEVVPGPAPRTISPRSVSQPSSNLPSDEELLADVADLAAQAASRTPLASPTISSSSLPLIAESDLSTTSDTRSEGDKFLEENRMRALSPPTVSSSTSTTTQDSQISISEEIALLQTQMAARAENAVPASPSTTTSEGFLDPQIDGSSDLGGRGLVSPDRLNLNKYLTQRNPNWKDSITVNFLVDPQGFIVAILNERDFSLYTDLQLAIYRLFIRDGQAFVAVTTPGYQEGSITFRLR
ncbi:MAG: hypothetical protein GW949_06710 [Spirochaetales bacterium]|nr:hypothetical protein [Spirochaetales bacterium]